MQAHHHPQQRTYCACCSAPVTLQDIHAWLCGLHLGRLLEQHLQQPQQPLLANPMCNGLLLAGIAEAVSQHHSQPLATIPQRPVTDLAAARGNLLAAASRLGMVSGGFAAAAGAVAAARDRAVAGGSGAASSPLAERGREWRSIASTGRSSPLGGERRTAPSLGGRSPSRSRRSPGRGSYAAACVCFTATAAAATGACGFAAVATGACSCGCDLCACSSATQLGGSVAEHAVLHLLEGVLAGDAACQWGLLFGLWQTYCS
jgi:hypothetical protein